MVSYSSSTVSPTQLAATQAEVDFLEPFVNASAARQTANTTNNTAVLADLGELGLIVPAAGTYEFRYELIYSVDVTTQGIGVALKASGAPAFSTLAYEMTRQASGTSHTRDNATAFDILATTATVGTAGTVYSVRIGGIIVATGAGTITPQFRIGSGTGGIVTLRSGSYGIARKIA